MIGRARPAENVFIFVSFESGSLVTEVCKRFICTMFTQVEKSRACSLKFPLQSRISISPAFSGIVSSAIELFASITCFSLLFLDKSIFMSGVFSMHRVCSLVLFVKSYCVT